MSVKHCKGYENIGKINKSSEIAFEAVFSYISAETNDERLKCIGTAHEDLIRTNPDNMQTEQNLPKRIPKDVCKMLVEFNTWIRCQLKKIKNVRTKEEHLSIVKEYACGMSKYFLWMGIATKYFI